MLPGVMVQCQLIASFIFSKCMLPETAPGLGYAETHEVKTAAAAQKAEVKRIADRSVLD